MEICTLLVCALNFNVTEVDERMFEAFVNLLETALKGVSLRCEKYWMVELWLSVVGFGGVLWISKQVSRTYLNVRVDFDAVLLWTLIFYFWSLLCCCFVLANGESTITESIISACLSQAFVRLCLELRVAGGSHNCCFWVVWQVEREVSSFGWVLSVHFI